MSIKFKEMVYLEKLFLSVQIQWSVIPQLLLINDNTLLENIVS